MKNIFFPFFILILIFSACKQEQTTTASVASIATFNPLDIEAKLKSLKIDLPKMATPTANYVHTVRAGNLVYTAGKGSAYPDGKLFTGKLGKDLSVKQGQEAARMAGIRLLGALKAELGNLNKVKRIVKVLGMVNASPDFEDHSSVINGFSDLMVEVFGESGKHARSAVGVASLPKNLAIEIEMIVEVYED